MNKRAQGMPIQTIGIIVLVVIVIVAVAVFFFSGLGEQGGIISSSSKHITGNISQAIDYSALPGWKGDS